ncbi:MAG: porin [Alphaproteobacteria bacterium]
MKRQLRFALLLSTSALGMSQAMALDITVNGRVDFLPSVGNTIVEQRNQAYTGPAHNNNGGVAFTTVTTTAVASADNAAASNTGQGIDTFIAYLDDYKSDSDVTFDTNARIDVKAVGETATFDYGAFVRIDIDPDAKAVSDTDAHVFIKGNFGELQFGTDIDADRDSFDMDLMSAGPMSAGNQISLPTADHTFSKASHDESSVVYTTPSLQGFKFAGEIDDDGDWMLGGSFDTVYNGMDIGVEGAFDNSDAFALRGRVDMGDLSFGALAGYDDDDESYWGGGIGYSINAISLSLEATLAKAEMRDTANDNAFVNVDELDIVGGIGFKVAPGLTLAGSIGFFDREVEGNDIGTAAVSWAGSGHQLKGFMGQGRIRLEF